MLPCAKVWCAKIVRVFIFFVVESMSDEDKYPYCTQCVSRAVLQSALYGMAIVMRVMLRHAEHIHGCLPVLHLVCAPIGRVLSLCRSLHFNLKWRADARDLVPAFETRHSDLSQWIGHAEVQIYRLDSASNFHGVYCSATNSGHCPLQSAQGSHEK